MTTYSLLPEDLYNNIKLNLSTEVEDYIKTLEYNSANINFITKLFMYAVDQRSYDTAKVLACYGANTHGWGDWAKYYTMRLRTPFIDPVINTPLLVCCECNSSNLCRCGCNDN